MAFTLQISGAGLFLWQAGSCGMLSSKDLVADLCHSINSPLAAIRNALYLASCRSNDPELLRYLELADEEVEQISRTLRQARAEVGCPRLESRAPKQRRAAA